MKKIFFQIIFLFVLTLKSSFANEKLYEKIDIFGEVLEKIKDDYVD